MKVVRQIIVIDEEKCDGCGQCIPSCPEGAIEIVQTPQGPKARLVRESFCDGLGACIGECPQGAITLEEREAEPFDEKGVEEFMRAKGTHHHHDSMGGRLSVFCAAFLGG